MLGSRGTSRSSIPRLGREAAIPVSCGQQERAREIDEVPQGSLRQLPQYGSRARLQPPPLPHSLRLPACLRHWQPQRPLSHRPPRRVLTQPDTSPARDSVPACSPRSCRRGWLPLASVLALIRGRREPHHRRRCRACTLLTTGTRHKWRRPGGRAHCPARGPARSTLSREERRGGGQRPLPAPGRAVPGRVARGPRAGGARSVGVGGWRLGGSTALPGRRSRCRALCRNGDDEVRDVTRVPPAGPGAEWLMQLKYW